MSDIVDDAAEAIEQMVEVALANRPKTAIEFTGKCHYCEEPISKGSFCSRECGEDYQKLERAKQFKGAA